MEKPADLTWKQWQFVEEYVAGGFNGTEAAKKAAYAPASAASLASALLSLPKISQAVSMVVASERAERAERYSPERVLRELETNSDLAREAGQLGPANRAWELIGKHGGMFVDRVESVHLGAEYRFTMQISESAESESLALDEPEEEEEFGRT